MKLFELFEAPAKRVNLTPAGISKSTGVNRGIVSALLSIVSGQELLTTLRVTRGVPPTMGEFVNLINSKAKQHDEGSSMNLQLKSVSSKLGAYDPTIPLNPTTKPERFKKPDRVPDTLKKPSRNRPSDPRVDPNTNILKFHNELSYPLMHHGKANNPNIKKGSTEYDLQTNKGRGYYKIELNRGINVNGTYTKSLNLYTGSDHGLELHAVGDESSSVQGTGGKIGVYIGSFKNKKAARDYIESLD